MTITYNSLPITEFQIGDLVSVAPNPLYVNFQQGLGMVINTFTDTAPARFDWESKKATGFRNIQFVEVYWQQGTYGLEKIPAYLLQLEHRDKSNE